MRSVYSNPVGSAIDAFAKVSGVLEERSNNAIKRDMMEQEMADKKVRMDRDKVKASREDEQYGWLKQIHEDTDFAGKMVSTWVKMDANKKAGLPETEGLTPDENSIILKAVGQSELGGDLADLDAKKTAGDTFMNFVKSNPQAMAQKGIIDLDQAGIKKAVNTLWGSRFNEGDSLYGPGASKEAVKVVSNPDTKTITPVLRVSKKVPDQGIVTRHTQIDGKSDIYMAPSVPEPQGLVTSGNIDLSKRPLVLRKDGKMSTVLTSSFEEDGNTILLPLVSDDGRILKPEEAWKEFKNPKSPGYGKNLGVFANREDADAYAMDLHNDPIWQADIQKHKFNPDTGEWSYEAPLTRGRGTGGDAPIAQIRTDMIGAQLSASDRLFGAAQAVLAKMDPKTKMATIVAQRKTREENKAIRGAIAAVDNSADSATQQRQFVEKFTELAPDAALKDTVALWKNMKQTDRKGNFKPLEDSQGNVTYVDMMDEESVQEAGKKGLKPYRAPQKWEVDGGGGGKEKVSAAQRTIRQKQLDVKLRDHLVNQGYAGDEDTTKAELAAAEVIDAGGNVAQAFAIAKQNLPEKKEPEKEIGDKVAEVVKGAWKRVMGTKKEEPGKAPKTRAEYAAALKKANPKATDKEINEHLDKKGVK